MSASFHFDAGPFSVTVELDDGGITFRQKTLARERTEKVRWDQVSHATLVRPGQESDDGDQENERVARLFGAEAVAKYRELHGKVGQIFLACRDERSRLRQMEIPARWQPPRLPGTPNPASAAGGLGKRVIASRSKTDSIPIPGTSKRCSCSWPWWASLPLLPAWRYWAFSRRS